MSCARRNLRLAVSATIVIVLNGACGSEAGRDPETAKRTETAPGNSEAEPLPPTLEATPDRTTADTALAPEAAPEGAASPPAQVKSRPNDEQIAGAAEAVISAQIEQAKLASLKTKNPEVKRLAGMLLSRYGEAQQRQAKLKTKPAQSELSGKLGVDAANAKKRLDSATGAEFDRIYISTQVDAHKKLLELLDSELLPNVSNPDLKALLLDAKPKLQEQLRSLEAARRSVGPAKASSDANAR